MRVAVGSDDQAERLEERNGVLYVRRDTVIRCGTVPVILDISGRGVTELDESIGGLAENPEVLYCNKNKLAKLPESIGSLVNLKKLYCYNNQLTKLPESIGSLVKLRELYCRNNKLSELPESIGSLTNLHLLNCDNNQLTKLPESIGSLANLEKL